MTRHPLDDDVRAIITLSGGFPAAVENTVGFSRACWALAMLPSQREYPPVERQGLTLLLRTVPLPRLWHKYLGPNVRRDRLYDAILQACSSARMCWRYGPAGSRLFDLAVFQPLELTRLLMARIGQPDHELQYYVRRSIRRYYIAAQTPGLARQFRLMANVINAIMTDPVPDRQSGARPAGRIIGYDLIRRRLDATVDTHQRAPGSDPVDLFLECCRMVGCLAASENGRSILVRTLHVDSEFLISQLFGLPTGLRGFDELFGGGGIILSEDVLPGQLSTHAGRRILIVGRYGTGKTILSLQLAMEVASKGGCAWVMPLEQATRECLYSIASVLPLRANETFRIASTAKEAEQLLRCKPDGRGILVILKSVKDSPASFLAAIEDNASLIGDYPLRLIAADPINSVTIEPGTPTSHLRGQMLDAIFRLSEQGTNVLLVAEESEIHDSGQSPDSLAFAENISDIVIRLSVRVMHDYSQRLLEIRKSRHQREQHGEHPFSIVSGGGISISPTSAATMARIQPRVSARRPAPTEFGLQSLDRLLGRAALCEGNVIALQGPGGSYKTPLGLLFLLGPGRGGDRSFSPDSEIEDGRQPRPTRSLFIAARDDEGTIQRLLDQPFLHLPGRPSAKERIILVPFPKGYVKPGQIFNRLEDEFLRAHIEGYRIGRVLVDNVAHWEMSCPFLRSDVTFGDTLLEFLRRRRVTSLIICGELASQAGHSLQTPILDDADCVIRLDRFEFRGQQRVLGKVVKTPSMQHRRDSFEVMFDAHKLTITPSPLLRVVGPHQVTPVDVHLFLHSESTLQAAYNDAIVRALKATVSPNVTIEPQAPIFQTGAMRLGLSSTVDQLQILQLDEFQIRPVQTNEQESILRRFPCYLWDDSTWGGCFDSILRRVRFADGSFIAVPYFQNVGLLAFRTDCKEMNANEEVSRATAPHRGPGRVSWDMIARACKRWESNHTDEKEMFFDFPKGTEENYNCLFFEILLSLDPIRPRRREVPDDFCPMRRWLNSTAAVRASLIFRRLCRRSYYAGGGRDLFGFRRPVEVTKEAPLTVNRGAQVWRHWYTTLNQMMCDMSVDDRRWLAVDLLPADASVAGEWYLGIPECSAAPEVGLELIKLITSRESELDRARSGVGLPIRCAYYSDDRDGHEVSVSPYFSMDAARIGAAVDGSSSRYLRRSDFGCYFDFSRILTSQLQDIIEVPDGTVEDTRARIREIFQILGRRMTFVGSHRSCRQCRFRGKYGGSFS